MYMYVHTNIPFYPCLLCKCKIMYMYVHTNIPFYPCLLCKCKIIYMYVHTNIPFYPCFLLAIFTWSMLWWLLLVLLSRYMERTIQESINEHLFGNNLTSTSEVLSTILLMQGAQYCLSANVCIKITIHNRFLKFIVNVNYCLLFIFRNQINGTLLVRKVFHKK